VTRARTILVVEDGTEYADAFREMAATPLEIVRAADLEEARRALASRAVDAVFLDVVFDRTAPEKLAGDREELIRRFGGDRPRAERHLAENQGFYLLNALAPLLPEGTRVVLAYDFSAEPERLAALRKTWQRLEGIADGTPISRVVDSLLAEVDGRAEDDTRSRGR
jgi:hypothetical protein